MSRLKHKGYSYDAHQVNLRHTGYADSARDSLSKIHDGFSRTRVHGEMMNEIGFENCDWISPEVEWWKFWPSLVESFKAYNFTVEMHVPCRDPLEHLMSICNHWGKTFDCTTENMEEEVQQCMVLQGRFGKELLAIDGLTLHCFDPIPVNRYIEYMDHYLQRKRIDGGYKHRPTNHPRDKSKECIWNEDNEQLRSQVIQIMMEHPYFAWCQECLGTEQDLFVNV